MGRPRRRTAPSGGRRPKTLPAPDTLGRRPCLRFFRTVVRPLQARPIMTNAIRLPAIMLALAAASGALVALTARGGEPLSELQIGLTAWAFCLAIFGLQGLISVVSEGRELRPGRVP